MSFFELEPADITNLNDADLRELVARLCEAELVRQNLPPSCVSWGGAQEAADGGLDIRVKNAKSLNENGFIPCENTGFQIKKNGMSKAACKKEMLFEGEVKPVIQDLAAQKGAYIIVSGKDDCSEKMLKERLTGMQSAIEKLPNKDDLKLYFYGRDKLSLWLRQFPGVALWARAKLGKPLSGWKPFGRWTGLPPDQDDEFLFDEYPCLIDQDSTNKDPISIADGINLVRDKMRESKSVVRITGLSGVGKTRFAQALFETTVCEDALPSSNVIYADLGESLTPTPSELIDYLSANNQSAYLVMDNCPSGTHRNLQKQMKSSQASLRLLTIEYDISEDQPEETESIDIEPSSVEIVSKLIQKRFPELGCFNADTISKFAGGNARIAIALANRVDKDETLSKFSDDELFRRLFNQRKGEPGCLLDHAEILSLVYSFNVSPSEYNNELGVLAKISEFERSSLNRSHVELIERQLSQQRGNWRAVLPHALANRLARRALKNIPPDSMNEELFKTDNLRLFVSCAHRLGYLHDFEPARKLANSWIQKGGPLNDIASCSYELLTALVYIAPLFPEKVLKLIEEASLSDPNFCSRSNQHFSLLVSLLRKLAYDDELFDRAAVLILNFAETEKKDENYDSIVSRMKGLFSLRLSGTQATPARRQAFVNRMLSTEKPRYFEIAHEIFQSALNTAAWRSYDSFNFGARKRDFGWEPRNNEEELDWYEGFIKLLEPFISSEKNHYREWSRKIFKSNFSGLCNIKGCFDILEKIVSVNAIGGDWPEMWLTIKKMIHNNEKNLPPTNHARLENLERLTAPCDLYTEIETYVLTNFWDHIVFAKEVRNIKTKEINDKIVKLGELASCEPELLKRLAPKLFEKNNYSLCTFGKGIVNGVSDLGLMFEFLVRLMQEQGIESVEPILFRGFLAGSHAKNPSLIQHLHERILEILELKPHFIYLLDATPITPWGIKKLIELAKTRDLETWRFKGMSKQIHDFMSDEDLFELLSALNEFDDGIFSTLEILSTRFYTNQDKKRKPSDSLQSLGRQTIKKLLSMDKKVLIEHKKDEDTEGSEIVYKECLSETTPSHEIQEIVNLLCEGIVSYHLDSIDFVNLIYHLFNHYPEAILNAVFEKEKNTDHLLSMLFKKIGNRYGSLLSLLSSEWLIKWCNGDQNRIQILASIVDPCVNEDMKKKSKQIPNKVVLSNHIKALLEVAEDKTAIINTLYSRLKQKVCSGSRVNAIKERFIALSELQDYPSPEVQNIVKEKLSAMKNWISEISEEETERYSQCEHSFE